MKNPLPQTARAAALQTLLEVEKGGFPDESLDRIASHLDRRDRALASALVLGVLRHKTRLEWTARQFLDKPDKKIKPVLRLILSLGFFQLWRMSRVPQSAAVDESVKLAKAYGPPKSSGLINAVLRNALRVKVFPDPVDSKLPDIEKLALIESHPLWLVQRYVDHLGLEDVRALLAANNEPPPLTIRTNCRKTNRNDLAALLASQGLEVLPTPYAPDGLMIIGPTGPIRDLPGYDDGLFAVQDEASQLVGLLGNIHSDARILDACTGRGGKAMHLAEQTDNKVIGLDPDGRRLALAAEEAQRLGIDNIELIKGDLLENPPLDEKSFDLVLVDAPCSNLGVIRRRPDVKWSKNPDDPDRLSETQKALLTAAAKFVKPEGRLVYSVCTQTPEETLAVTDDFWMNHLEFGLKPVATFLPESARDLADPDGVMRAWPHKHNTDGFFAAIFDRKPTKPPDFEV
jgi:16S rRNA (cytosine967-C5)-methyltransferase